MRKAGEKITEAMAEALSIARGEQPAARIFHRGHAYVPEQGWQSIGAAPQDGTDFLALPDRNSWPPDTIRYELYDAETAEEVGEPGYWRYSDDAIADIATIEDGNFTIWHPLPPPPGKEATR